MRSNYKAIGELVERVDIRNTDGSIDTLIGLSIEKCFIRSVANTIGTDLTKYKKIQKNQFAVSLMQVSRDEKIPVACLKEFDEAIMSPCYLSLPGRDLRKSQVVVKGVFLQECVPFCKRRKSLYKFIISWVYKIFHTVLAKSPTNQRTKN